ncbi:MAG: hypothetical protein OEW11_03705 [Nitrospirota bacterium]|nr:hypothetical protein [Nitrospirota bacterium]
MGNIPLDDISGGLSESPDTSAFNYPRPGDPYPGGKGVRGQHGEPGATGKSSGKSATKTVAEPKGKRPGGRRIRGGSATSDGDKVVGGAVHQKRSVDTLTPEERLKSAMSSMVKAKVRDRRLLLAIPLILIGLLVGDLLFFEHGTYPEPPLEMVSNELIPGPVIADMQWAGSGDNARLAVQNGAAYPLLLSALRGGLGTDVGMARLMNAGLHAATALLLFVLAMRIGSFATGVTTLVLVAVNPSFTYMASQLLAENLVAFLLVLSAWLGVVMASPARPWYRVAAVPVMGFTLFFLALTRPGLGPLALILVAITGIHLLREWRESRSSLGAVAVVLFALCLLLPWLGWQGRISGIFEADSLILSPYGLSSGATLADSAHDPARNGWPYPAADMGPHSLYVAPPVMESIAGNPLHALALYPEKVFRQWFSPAGGRALPTPLAMWGVAAHGVILVLAVLGLTRLRTIPALPFLLLPVLWVVLAYPLGYGEERRFVFGVMPLLTLFAALALRHMWVPLMKRVWPLNRLRPKPLEMAWLVAAGVVAYWAGLTEDGFVAVSSLDPWLTHASGVAGLLLVAGMAAWRLARVLHADSAGPRAAAVLLLLVCVLLPLTVHALWFSDWRTFAVTLKDPGQSLEQTFTLPAGLDLGTARAITLQLDVLDRDGSAANVEVRVNHRLQHQLLPVSVTSPAYRQVLRGMESGGRDLYPDIPQWLTYRLDPEKLAGERSVNVSVALAAGEVKRGQRLIVFGDLPHGSDSVGGGPAPWIAPEDRQLVTRPLLNGRASLWRHGIYGDMRLYGITPLEGVRRSAYIPEAGMPADTDDLSPALYRQPGAYRIHLQVITANGTEVIL